MTLGACAVKDTRGHRIVLRCSLAEALQSSSPVTSRKLVNYADQRSKFENQFPSDPIRLSRETSKFAADLIRSQGRVGLLRPNVGSVIRVQAVVEEVA